MFKISIYLKSGQMVEFYVTEFNITKKLTGEISELTWSSVEPKTHLPRLLKIDVDEILAITSTLQKDQ